MWDRMEQDIRTLPVSPVSSDDCSRGYITYDPKQIDIFPLSVQVKNESIELAQSNYLSDVRNEKDEKRLKRLSTLRQAQRFRRRNETTEQRLERLRKDREKKREYREKMRRGDAHDDVLQRNRIIMRLRRQNEAYREKERERDRIRHQIRRADVDFRTKEKLLERERKRLLRQNETYRMQEQERDRIRHQIRRGNPEYHMSDFFKTFTIQYSEFCHSSNVLNLGRNGQVL